MTCTQEKKSYHLNDRATSIFFILQITLAGKTPATVDYNIVLKGPTPGSHLDVAIIHGCLQSYRNPEVERNTSIKIPEIEWHIWNTTGRMKIDWTKLKKDKKSNDLLHIDIFFDI